MTHTEYLERFSKSLALFSPGDPEAADELRTSLAEWQDAVGEHAPPAIEETCKRIQELLEGLESKDDAGATVEELSALLTALQDQASELESEGTDSDDGDPIDHELLGLFVASCETTLSDLEGEVLGAEKADDPAESIAGVRRTIHTFKGECGVLSLSVAQELCHRMETAIDQALEGNLHIPTDLILELVDWLRSYVDRLKHDNRAEPPQSQKLSDGIDAYLNGETPEQQSACRQASEESPDDRQRGSDSSRRRRAGDRRARELRDRGGLPREPPGVPLGGPVASRRCRGGDPRVRQGRPQRLRAHRPDLPLLPHDQGRGWLPEPDAGRRSRPHGRDPDGRPAQEELRVHDAHGGPDPPVLRCARPARGRTPGRGLHEPEGAQDADQGPQGGDRQPGFHGWRQRRSAPSGKTQEILGEPEESSAEPEP